MKTWIRLQPVNCENSWPTSTEYLNILASRNRDSGAVETYIPDTETAFDWLNYHS